MPACENRKISSRRAAANLWRFCMTICGCLPSLEADGLLTCSRTLELDNLACPICQVACSSAVNLGKRKKAMQHLVHALASSSPIRILTSLSMVTGTIRSWAYAYSCPVCALENMNTLIVQSWSTVTVGFTWTDGSQARRMESRHRISELWLIHPLPLTIWQKIPLPVFDCLLYSLIEPVVLQREDLPGSLV